MAASPNYRLLTPTPSSINDDAAEQLMRGDSSCCFRRFCATRCCFRRRQRGENSDDDDEAALQAALRGDGSPPHVTIASPSAPTHQSLHQTPMRRRFASLGTPLIIDQLEADLGTDIRPRGGEVEMRGLDDDYESWLKNAFSPVYPRTPHR